MPAEITVQHGLMLLGLSFFVGLAFEGFYLNSRASRPGGIRTFPLLTLAGGFLYLLEPRFMIAFFGGLLVLGAWLYPYYRSEVAAATERRELPDGIMVPVCNLMVFLLGPIVLTQPAWVAVGLAVLVVLLLRARAQLHALAERIPGSEIITLVQFLIIAGIILPLLPRTPVFAFTTLTPFQVWLAVVVVCSISYASYLLQRFVSPQGSVFFASLLGGMYSSTATTVVLARRLPTDDSALPHLRAGIVLATGVMYLRIGILVAIFNIPLTLSLAPSLLVLSVLAGIGSFAMLKWHGRDARDHHGDAIKARNPLDLGIALTFAAVFVVISVVTVWIQQQFGSIGIYGLAAAVGVTDIDPFVLSVAHTSGGEHGLVEPMVRDAILIAASSNNMLKAIYILFLGGWRAGWLPLVALLTLAAAGVAGAIVL
jgi:uncharacterized membrane protein (DUF4010 family)